MLRWFRFLPRLFDWRQIRPSIFCMKKIILSFAAILLAFALPAQTPAGPPPRPAPVKLIFDTDIGNDIDDVLALAVLHALQSRGDCEMLAVTVTKPDELAWAIRGCPEHFLRTPGIPIGCVRPEARRGDQQYLPLVDVKDGTALRYPHRLKRGSDAEEPVRLLRRILSRQPDRSVVWCRSDTFQISQRCSAPPATTIRRSSEPSW